VGTKSRISPTGFERRCLAEDVRNYSDALEGKRRALNGGEVATSNIESNSMHFTAQNFHKHFMASIWLALGVSISF
jgi:hypothetical protein